MFRSRYSRVLPVWMMLASSAEPKSSENWWILVVVLLRIRFISQLIMSCSMKVGTTASLILHFWSKAKQNRCSTELFS